DPRACRQGPAALSIDAARITTRGAARRGLRVQRHRHLLRDRLSQAAFRRAPIFARLDQLVGAQPRMHGGDAAFGRLRHRKADRGGGLSLPQGRTPLREVRARGGLSREESGRMIEAAMIWNEPNNKSHWDPELAPDWSRFARMGRIAGEAIGVEAPGLTRVLGGISPIDPNFVSNMIGQGLFDQLDAVAVHGFPLDWNLWPID